MTHHLRRRIRHTGQKGQRHSFMLYSRTVAGTRLKYEPWIDLASGRVHCNCTAADVKSTHAPLFFDWIEGEKKAPCWHLQRASEWLNAHGFLAHLIVNLRPCIREGCDNKNAKFECCSDWYGRNVVGFICEAHATQQAADSMGVPKDTEDTFLASHGPTVADKQAEAEYFAEQRKRDAYADYTESQLEAQWDAMEDDYDEEDDWASDDLPAAPRLKYCGEVMTV